MTRQPNLDLKARPYSCSRAAGAAVLLIGSLGLIGWDLGIDQLLFKEPSGAVGTFVPGRLCIELKSLKLYLWSFRNEGHFHEAVTNRILDDLVKACQPRSMKLVADFYVRGGIHTVITASYQADEQA